MAGGSAGPSRCLDRLSPHPPVPPHPHLPLPAHRGEEGVQWCGERVSLRGHTLGAGGRPWLLHEGDVAQTAQTNVPATTLSCGSSVAGDGHPEALLPTLPTHCSWWLSLGAGSYPPLLPSPRLCPLKQGLLRCVCFDGGDECLGLLPRLPEHQRPCPKAGIKMQAQLFPTFPPHPSATAAPCLCPWVLGEEGEVKGQVCLMAVREGPRHPTCPGSIPLMLLLSLGLAMGPHMALS